ncbi:MAG TPA: ParA family protein [Tepidisphaeraceae bacterium]|nr:ParA family protein [Tepidisphaeraceae bacterium]
MPTISLASSKGGAGKSTSAVLLATELAQRGAAVTIIDADPNQPVLRWSRKPGKPKNLTVIGDVSEETLIDAIDDAARKTAFVIVDLEGTASVMVAHAMTRSDLVIIPTKGSELDGIEAAKVIQFINRQERAYHRKIPFAVLFTQTNPAVRPRTLKSLEADMLQQGVPVLGTPLHERDAYRAIFSFGGSLAGLKPNLVRNVPAAISNAREFMVEVIAMLKRQAEEPAPRQEVA